MGLRCKRWIYHHAQGSSVYAFFEQSLQYINGIAATATTWIVSDIGKDDGRLSSVFEDFFAEYDCLVEAGQLGSIAMPVCPRALSQVPGCSPC
jgi:hypothetical protein